MVDCCICLETKEKTVVIDGCNHELCMDCFNTGRLTRCPLCRHEADKVFEKFDDEISIEIPSHSSGSESNEEEPEEYRNRSRIRNRSPPPARRRQARNSRSPVRRAARSRSRSPVFETFSEFVQRNRRRQPRQTVRMSVGPRRAVSPHRIPVFDHTTPFSTLQRYCDPVFVACNIPFAQRDEVFQAAMHARDAYFERI
jgi:hypothetical protein